MKKAFKIVGILLIAALCSFTMGMGSNNFFESSLNGAGETREENKSYFTAVSVNLFYFTPKSESSLNTFNTTSSTFKTPFKEFAVVVKTTEQFFDSKFIQYNFSLKNCLFRYRKSDIIFPFHYFW